MIIHIRISPHVVGFLPGEQTESRTLEVPEGITLAQVMDLLKVPGDLEAVAVVNHVFCSDTGRVINDGDLVELIPLIVGG